MTNMSISQLIEEVARIWDKEVLPMARDIRDTYGFKMTIDKEEGLIDLTKVNAEKTACTIITLEYNGPWCVWAYWIDDDDIQGEINFK